MIRQALGMLKGTLCGVVLAAVTILASAPAGAVALGVGAPLGSVPTSLSDPLGSLGAGLQPDQFLLPIQVAGAADLQDWTFDLGFDATVVTLLDIGGLTQWVYAAAFDVADPTVSDITSGGLALAGAVQGVAGFSHGVSGNGLLAFILFQYLPGQQGLDPRFELGGPTGVPLPEPAAWQLVVMAGLLGAFLRNTRWRARPGRRI